SGSRPISRRICQYSEDHGDLSSAISPAAPPTNSFAESAAHPGELPHLTPRAQKSQAPLGRLGGARPPRSHEARCEGRLPFTALRGYCQGSTAPLPTRRRGV